MDETNLSQESKTSIVEKIEDLELCSSEIDGTCSQPLTASSESSASSSSSISQDNEEPQKRRRRRRRRKRKKLTTSTTAYEPDEPFPKRYKVLVLDLKVAPKPKFHIKFDEAGNVDEKQSKYNYRARVIKALQVALTVSETAKGKSSIEAMQTQLIESRKVDEEAVVSLKPRIIKASEHEFIQ